MLPEIREVDNVKRTESDIAIDDVGLEKA